MATDLIRIESPAGQAELAWLTTVKVGDVRRGILFPALDVGVEWVCTVVSLGRWEFAGQFFGQPLCHATITLQDETLQIEMKEPV